MDGNGSLTPFDVAASGLAAERARVGVIGRNIANANVTRTTDGGPYRRQRVLFETVLKQSRNPSLPQGSVKVREIADDLSPFRIIHDPNHPDQVDGVVRYPNVDLPLEMVDLMDASRSYEANVVVMRIYREMLQQTLDITR